MTSIEKQYLLDLLSELRSLTSKTQGEINRRTQSWSISTAFEKIELSTLIIVSEVTNSD